MWNSYTNEELLDMVLELSEKLGRPPRKMDMKNANKVPSVWTYYKRFNTTKWSEVLEICNLRQIWDKGYDKSFGLNKLKEYHKELCRIPTYKDFKKFKWIPEFNWYAKNFGSFKNACYLAGLSKKPLSKDERKEFSIKEINNLYRELNKIPTQKEYDEYRSKGYSSSKIPYIFGLPYTQFCAKYIKNYHNKYFITLDEYKQIVRGLLVELGRTPTCDETGYTYSFLSSKFNKRYTEILYEMQLEPFQYNRITDDELLRDFRLLYQQLGHVPSYEELDNSSITCNGVTYNRRFGGIESVCSILNIEFDRNFGTGFVCYDDNNILCKSTKERDISNFFIKNNIAYEKEVSYNELIDGDRRVFDWKIVYDDNTYYVEYFGLYFMNKKSNKIVRSYIHKTRKKIKDLFKNGSIDRCIFIFPSNIHDLNEFFDLSTNKL